jgi:hypothetical protein
VPLPIILPFSGATVCRRLGACPQNIGAHALRSLQPREPVFSGLALRLGGLFSLKKACCEFRVAVQLAFFSAVFHVE